MASPSSLPQRVLVIDDDEVMRDILSLVLGAEGHSVLAAESGDAGLLALQAQPPNEAPTVVLTDLQMPGLTGAALAQRLRAACPQATTLIAMSGSRPKNGEANAYDAFLLKPFSAEEVVAAVTERGRAAAAGQGVAAAAETLPALDEAIYAKLSATLPSAQLRELYSMCLDDALQRVERMTAAAKATDAAAFTREAHAIKGGCGMLGATELHRLASRMEEGALSCTPLLDEFAVAAGRLRRMLEARS